jgi:hypothetical protein
MNWPRQPDKRRKVEQAAVECYSHVLASMADYIRQRPQGAAFLLELIEDAIDNARNAGDRPLSPMPSLGDTDQRL